MSSTPWSTWTMRWCVFCVVERLRLSGGPSRCSGSVEVMMNQSGAEVKAPSWSSVCGSHFSLHEAAVVCAELDCGAVSELHQGTKLTKGSSFHCEGAETSLTDCESSEETDCSTAATLTCSGNDCSPYSPLLCKPAFLYCLQSLSPQHRFPFCRWFLFFKGPVPLHFRTNYAWIVHKIFFVRVSSVMCVNYACFTRGTSVFVSDCTRRRVCARSPVLNGSKILPRTTCAIIRSLCAVCK